MAENERQTDDLKPPRRPDVLRAKDIIPGTAPTGDGQGVNNTDIPRFNLADDIMAEHRRLTAGRRKGPGSASPTEPPPVASPSAPIPDRKPFLSRYGFSNGFNTAADPVIADIVARDIDRLCRGL
jgi:hypothetical protein